MASKLLFRVTQDLYMAQRFYFYFWKKYSPVDEERYGNFIILNVL